MSQSTWEHPALTFEHAEAFIRRRLPDAVAVEGPISVFADYQTVPDLRVTALFALTHPSVDRVVVKANRFPFLQGSGDAHRIVSRCAPQFTPTLLGSEDSLDEVLLLHDFFEGQPIGDSQTIAETARTLAEIQRSASPFVDGSRTLQRTETAALPELFRQVIGVIRSHFEAAWWPDEGGKIGKAMGFPGAEVLERLESLQDEFDQWVEALKNSSLALSLDHGDCHAGNAAMLESGGVVIFDWENASIAHPFLSVEKLMTSAWALDMGVKGGPRGYVRDTPTQDVVRDAYMAALGVEGPAEARAFDAAMCLATVKEMAHEMEWARLCSWEYQNPEWTAQLIHRLFEHRMWRRQRR